MTWVLAACTLVAIAAAAPGALRDAQERGGVYLLSWAFLEDLPRRLTGPGRLRFIIQPATAILLGLRAGIADMHAGRPPYLMALLRHAEHRRAMFTEMFRQVANLVLIGILIDMIAQWLMLGQAYPAAALVVGPILICLPYSVARALGCRVAGMRKG
jgi:hypothetical protein